MFSMQGFFGRGQKLQSQHGASIVELAGAVPAVVAMKPGVDSSKLPISLKSFYLHVYAELAP
jgi:hypothetical protein